MFYTIYKITSKINNKIYIGCHQTKDLNDEYMGSGKYIKAAIEKHGIESFTKEILFIFDTPEEMYAKEAEIVNLKFLSEENTYNIKIGGFGGWDHENLDSDKQRAKSIKANAKIKSMVETDEGYRKKYLETKKSVASKNLKLAHALGKIKYDTFSGKSHCDASKSKIGKANSIHQTGTGNSQFGTIWITNGFINKKINKNDIIPDGWYKGRKVTL